MQWKFHSCAMTSIARQLIGWERCPHLGLHDDDSTCLAYASSWNYCYRATPPASVRTAYQVETCLCGRYVHCPVYLSSKGGALPRALRGHVSVGARGRRLLHTLVRMIGLIVLTAIVIWIIYLIPRFLP